MNTEGLPKRSPRETYSGIWGRTLYVVSRRGPEAAVEEAERRDAVWTAAYRMQLQRQGHPEMAEQLSDIEIDAWQVALHTATEHTIKSFVESETDATVLARLITREAKTGVPNERFIEQCDERIRELRERDES
jgi:hypothetical protein